MEIIIKQIFIYISAFAGIIAALANLRKKDGKLTLFGILLLTLICVSTLLSSVTQYSDYRKQQKAEMDMEIRIKAITDSIGVMLSQMRGNQEYIEDILVKAQIEERYKREIETRNQSQETLRKNVKKFLNSLAQNKVSGDSTKSVNTRMLIIDISRQIDNADIFVDGQLKGTSPQCTVYVTDSIHKITASYKNKLNQQFEYSKTMNVTTDMTLFIGSTEFQPK